MNKGTWFLVVLIIIGVIFVLTWLRKKIKVLNYPCVFFVSGAVKSGKSLLAVHLATKEYKSALLKWKIKKFFRLLLLPFKFKDKYARVQDILDAYDLELSKDEEDFDKSKLAKIIDCDNDLKDFLPPMLYSNIPLAGVRFNELTIDIIRRKVRIPNKSVVLIDEVSLLADSMLFKDDSINNDLMAFFKLFGHSTHGGKCIIDSQSMQDGHYSLRRCVGSYLWIYERKKFPFITIMKVREMMYANDGSVTNDFNEDVELSMRTIFMFNTSYDKYDCYCLSVFTDYLPVQVCYSKEVLSKKDDLKCYNIVSLNSFVKSLNESIKGKYPQTMEIVRVVDDEGVVHDEEEI